MSLKLHFLFSNFNFFKDNLSDFSEEHGERFHQDMKNIEKRYQGRWDRAMMGECIRGLVRETDNNHKRKTRSNVHLGFGKINIFYPRNIFIAKVHMHVKILNFCSCI